MEKEMLVKRLEENALEIRKDVITTCYRSAAAHLGGALSLCDVAVARRAPAELLPEQPTKDIAWTYLQPLRHARPKDGFLRLISQFHRVFLIFVISAYATP